MLNAEWGQHSTFSIQHSAFNIQHSTFSIQHSAFTFHTLVTSLPRRGQIEHVSIRDAGGGDRMDLRPGGE
jgi:hypothetical protein